ncbi:MAG TPA: ribonuclease III [Spongiibacteraceae bacterium]|nr:ribonuclease III [Spongiibacteraceae bacterium]HUH37409.1 ribonuclease III [Spongiibacteraceae bacterium]
MNDALALQRLGERLGYGFSDPDLLRRALTHRSAARQHNERLEFLGDALLSFVIAEALFERFPTCREGDLTRMRASLVRGSTLADIARELDLGACLKLGSGELKSGGVRRDSILADALEAIIAAIYREAGMGPCRERILAWFGERLAGMDGEAGKDPKTRLQEWLQARQRPLPDYRLRDSLGADHARQFVVDCVVAGVSAEFTGAGSSRRKAEQVAAEAALNHLQGNS